MLLWAALHTPFHFEENTIYSKQEVTEKKFRSTSELCSAALFDVNKLDLLISSPLFALS